MKKSLGAKTIAYPAPVFVVGSYNEQSQPNIMCVAWGGICCSQPPCMSISLRQATYSYQNLITSQAFTINIPSASQIKAADYTGIYSGRDENKFEELNLTPIKSELVNAPYIKEFPMVLECHLKEYHNLGLHTLFVGEIMDIKVDENSLDEHGNISIEMIDPVIFAAAERKYYRVGDYLADAFAVGKKP